MTDLSICPSCFIISNESCLICPSCDFEELLIIRTDNELAEIFQKKLCPRCLGETEREKTRRHTFQCKECDDIHEVQTSSCPPVCSVCLIEMELIDITEVYGEQPSLRCEMCLDSYDESFYNRKPRIRLNDGALNNFDFAFLNRPSRKKNKTPKEKTSSEFVCDLCNFRWQGHSFLCPKCDTIVPPLNTSTELLDTAIQSNKYWSERQQKEESKLVHFIFIVTFVSLLIFLASL